MITEEEKSNGADTAATLLIDASILGITNQSLVDAQYVIDTLLDIRLLINKEQSEEA